MTQTTRDYRNLRETEHVFDAAKLTSVVFKDYSMEHICRAGWGHQLRSQRLVQLDIGGEKCILPAPLLWGVINDLIDEADDDGWITRCYIGVPCVKGKLTISSMGLNQECLRDSIVQLRIGEHGAIVDLEELLRATRYT